MAIQRFTTTRLGGFSAAGRIAELQHSVLAPFLERELSLRHGRLFAEFQAEDSDVRSWYAEADAPPRRVADLTPERAETLRAAAAALLGDVVALADRLAAGGPRQVALAQALRAAATYPEDDLWCDGDQPIIVNWGFQKRDAPTEAPRPILEAGRARSAVGARTPMAAALQTSRRAAWTRWLWAPLWLLFALLVAGCFRLLLPACGLARGWPFSQWGTCEMAGVAPSADLAREGAQLEAEVRDAELRLAGALRDCAPTPNPAPILSPAPIASPAPARARGTDSIVEERLPPAAPRGDVEVSLVWEGHADLDLIIDCPDGGKLSQRSVELQACGGRLLRDVNKAGEPLLEHPIEHAAWDRPPPGDYAIQVQLYEYNDAPQGDVPFTVRVRRGADVRTFAGRVRGARAIVTAATVTF